MIRTDGFAAVLGATVRDPALHMQTNVQAAKRGCSPGRVITGSADVAPQCAAQFPGRECL
jgi:hypothetical protein